MAVVAAGITVVAPLGLGLRGRTSPAGVDPAAEDHGGRARRARRRPVHPGRR